MSSIWDEHHKWYDLRFSLLVAYTNKNFFEHQMKKPPDQMHFFLEIETFLSLISEGISIPSWDQNAYYQYDHQRLRPEPAQVLFPGHHCPILLEHVHFDPGHGKNHQDWPEGILHLACAKTQWHIL